MRRIATLQDGTIDAALGFQVDAQTDPTKRRGACTPSRWARKPRRDRRWGPPPSRYAGGERLAFDGRQDSRLQVRPDAQETHKAGDGAHHVFGRHLAALSHNQASSGGYFHGR